MDRLGAGVRPRGDRAARGGRPPARRLADGDVDRARPLRAARARRPRLGPRRRPRRPRPDQRPRLRAARATPASPPRSRRPPDLPELRLYQARVDGEPACVLATLDHDGDLGFYFVATHPDHRGLGLASRLISAALVEGREPRPRDLVAAGLADGRARLLAAGLLRGLHGRTCTSAADELLRRAARGRGRGAHSSRAASTRPRRIVARAAPGLQRILAQALEAGGWFAESHEAGDLRRARDRGPRRARARRAHAARRGGADGNDGWGGRRLGTGRGTAKRSEMQINFIGHATFELIDGDARVLIDPFLAPNNPAAQVSADDVEPTHILLTHGHSDHAADAVAVAKRTGRPVHRGHRARRLAGRAGRRERPSTPTSAARSTSDWGSVKLVPGLAHQHGARRDRDRARRAASSSASAARRSTTSATPPCSATSA